jgi:hypothetical protein
VTSAAVSLLYSLRFLLRSRASLHLEITINAAGLQSVLADYVAHYTRSRTHLALQKDTPVLRPVALPSGGRIVATSQVGGLHHRYDHVAA